MFCKTKAEYGILLYYENPLYVEKEFLPPALYLWDLTKRLRRDTGYPPMVLLTRGAKDSSFKVQHGFIYRDDIGNIIFEETAENGSQTALFFKETQSQNETLLDKARAFGIPSEVPVQTTSGVVYKSINKVPLDKGWVGALVLSRSEVTQCLVLQTLFGSDMPPIPTNCTDPSGKNDDMFWAWYPSPKPAELKGWLRSLSGKVSNANKSNILGAWSPRYEGFYRMTVVGSPKTNTSGEDVCQILYDDEVGQVSPAYLNSADDTETASSFFRRGPARSQLSVTLPIALRSKFDSNRTNNWGFSGCESIGPLFLLPHNGELLFGPRRSPEGFQELWTTALKEENTLSDSERGDIFSVLHADANENASDFFNGQIVLESPERYQLLEKTEILSRKEKRPAETDPESSARHKKRGYRCSVGIFRILCYMFRGTADFWLVYATGMLQLQFVLS